MCPRVHPVVAYTYSCDTCGPFDLRTRMGTAPSAAPCPTCDASSRRVWSVTTVTGRSRSGRAAQAEARVNERPRVVTATGTAAAPRITDPRQQRLPRP